MPAMRWTKWLIVAAIVVGCALAGEVLTTRHTAPAVAVQTQQAHRDLAAQPAKVGDDSAAAAAPPPPASRAADPAPDPTQSPPAQVDVIVTPRPQPGGDAVLALKPRPRAVSPVDRPTFDSGISEPLARAALSLVGADPGAEVVWASAINDPNLPPKARQNLIEDLNEDGFPDPKHITPDDLPLILNRMDLIEQLAPDAMDDVNAAAFLEAYTDLVNMVDRLSRN